LSQESESTGKVSAEIAIVKDLWCRTISPPEVYTTRCILNMYKSMAEKRSSGGTDSLDASLIPPAESYNIGPSSHYDFPTTLSFLLRSSYLFRLPFSSSSYPFTVISFNPNSSFCSQELSYDSAFISLRRDFASTSWQGGVYDGCEGISYSFGLQPILKHKE
jgi:hypothetical protein